MHATDWAGRSSRSLGADGTGIGVKQISIEFDRGPAAVSAARSALTPLDERVDPALLDDLRLLVSELVTNSVRHAEANRDGTVALRVEVEREGVRVEVIDAGTGFEPKKRDADRTRPGGWGLY